MGDEDERQLALRHKPLEEVEDLALDGHIESGDRLVGDDQLGLGGEGAGDGDALALPAAELVRVFLHLRRVQAHRAHEVAHRGGELATAQGTPRANRFRERVVDRQAGVE